MPSFPPVLEDATDVQLWRLEVLIEAGYPEEEAFLIAYRPDIDLHYAVELVTSRSCPIGTALRILL